MSFSFDIKREDSIILISLKGNLMNKVQIQPMLDEVEHYSNEGVKKLIISMADMDYMNSTGLSILINIFTQARNKGEEPFLILPISVLFKSCIDVDVNLPSFTNKSNIDLSKSDKWA